MILFSGEKTSCYICGKFVKVLDVHVAFKHGTEFSPCPLCKRTFNHPKALKMHLRRHRTQDKIEKSNDENDTLCSECGKVTSSKTALVRHINEVHRSEKDKPYMCTYCGKRFFIKSYKVNLFKFFHEKHKQRPTSGFKFSH